MGKCKRDKLNGNGCMKYNNKYILILRSKGYKLKEKSVIPPELKYKGTIDRTSALYLGEGYLSQDNRQFWEDMDILYTHQFVYPCSLKSFTSIINNTEWYGDETKERTKGSLKRIFNQLINGKISGVSIHGDECEFHLFKARNVYLEQNYRIDERGCTDTNITFNSVLVEIEPVREMLDTSKIIELP